MASLSRTRLLRVAVACTAVIAAASTAPEAISRTVRDGTGQTVTVNNISRIVSIGGAVTEILYALNRDKSIVAIDSTSLYPPRALADKKNVGYMRQLSAEGVLGVAPSLVLSIAGAGPKDTLSVLQAAKVPLVIVPDDFTGEGILRKIEIVSEAVDATKAGKCLSEAVTKDLRDLQELRARIKKPLRVMFVLSFVNGRAMVAGSNTAADGVIKLAGAVNAVTEYEGYKQISDEAVIKAQPEAILVMKRPGNDNVAIDEAFRHPALAVSPAAAARRFVSMDGLYLLGFGPRTAMAARDLATKLYNDLNSASLPPEHAQPIGEACH